MAKGKNAFKETPRLEQLEEIKRLVVIAMFSDDELMDRLVLKGGNALDLVHQVSTRASVDVDFSMSDDFPDGEQETYRRKVENALRSTFQLAGYMVFDVKMEEKPDSMTPDLATFWGGYKIEFKLIELAKFRELSTDLSGLRRHALQLGAGARFFIDISRYEYTEGKEEAELGNYRIYVYSPEMIVCEKFRAICQQMEAYGTIIRRGRKGTQRARDFLDIYTLINRCELDMAGDANIALLQRIFKAKRVPLELLREIEKERDFHRDDWPDVQATVKAGAKLEDFDFYFNFAVNVVKKMLQRMAEGS